MHELVKVGIERYNDLKRTIVRHEPTKDNAADEYYNDLAKYPHIYVLACLMDKKIKAEKAWHIPFEVCNYFNTLMATNILVREYHIELSDYYSIDISPDVQVKRIFYRMGLVENEEDVSSIVYKARELYPEFPGIIDVACWEIGRTYCNPTTPNCNECPLNHCCKKTL